MKGTITLKKFSNHTHKHTHRDNNNKNKLGQYVQISENYEERNY